jgi:hypothetical protein
MPIISASLYCLLCPFQFVPGFGRRPGWHRAADGCSCRADLPRRFRSVDDGVLSRRPGQVLVRVRAAGLDRGTWHFMAGQPYLFHIVSGLRAPGNPVPGLDVAGTVAAAGAGVTRLRSAAPPPPPHSRRDFTVNSTRRISIAAGALFILATITALAAAALEPALTGKDYLTGVASHPSQMAAAALVYLIEAGTSVGIAVVLYPVLNKVSAALALGSVVFRTIEAVMYTAAVVSLLSILTLGQQLATAPAANRAPIYVMADSLLSVRDHSTLAAVFAFSLGALMYYALFYRSRLVPRWLSGWGMAAALLIMTACLLALFSNSPVTGYKLLILPIAVQEMVFAVRLLVKGFSPCPIRPGIVRT